MQLYQDYGGNATYNAQRNLMGRTHYVDPDTLRWHKSRVLQCYVSSGGLLFAIITSDSLDWDNTKRGFRYTIFDVFGTVIDRPELKDAYRTSEQAKKTFWKHLGKLDPYTITLAGISNAERYHAQEMNELRAFIEKQSKAA